MSRPLRIQFAGALYHVTSRGNERRDIVLDDHDRKRRLDWLSRTVATYRLRLHAFVLMDNHEHLFVETPQPNLAAAMQYLNASYTGYFNHRYKRSGHLFQGRYHAVLIQNEGHYLEVSRYIHLNPVRAGIVSQPVEWRWSSYPGYVHAGRALPWVTYTQVLAEFGRDDHAARKAYQSFASAAVDRPIASPLSRALHGVVLGSEDFIARIRRLLSHRKDDLAVPQLRGFRDRPTIESIARAACEAVGAKREEWRRRHRCDNLARLLTAYVARSRYGYAAGEIAAALGYSDHCSVGYACRRASRDRRLRDGLKKIEKGLATTYYRSDPISGPAGRRGPSSGCTTR